MAKITIESSLGVKVFEGEDLYYTCLVSNLEVDGVVDATIYLESEATYIDRVDYIVTLLQEEGIYEDVKLVMERLRELDDSNED